MLPDRSFEYVPGPNDFTHDWYEGLPAVYRDLDTGGQQLLKFLSLLGDQASEVQFIAELAEAGDLTSPTATPDSLVPWLAQMVGLTTTAPTPVSQMRARMGSLDVLRYAGNASSIELVCKPLLTGDQWVSVRPHAGTPSGDPWLIGIFVRDSEAPADLSVITDAVVAAGMKPAGFGLVVNTVTVTWSAIDGLGDQWLEQDAAGATWAQRDNAAWQS